MIVRRCAIFLSYPFPTSRFKADLEKAVSFDLFRLPEIRFSKRPYYGTVFLFVFKVTWLRNYDPQQDVFISLDVERNLLRTST